MRKNPLSEHEVSSTLSPEVAAGGERKHSSLTKHFGGKNADDRDRRSRPRDRGGRVPRPARAERLRQDDDPPLHRGARDGRRRADRFGDRVVFDAAQDVNVPPNKRNIGMVFQSYALWPHMTVRKNIGYPLRTRGIKGDQAAEWIEEVAALVDTTPLLDRYPAQLSGGQQQRIALARGLVARPELVLFDEPLSNLDARLRDQVRTEIHELHAPARLHGRLRHARPGRGARARRPARDHARRRARATRGARRDLRGARDGVRRGLHRHGKPAGVRAARRRVVARGRAGRRRARRVRHGSGRVVARTRPEDIDLVPPDGDRAAPEPSRSPRRSSTPRSAAATSTSP